MALEYIDRRSGARLREEVFAGAFLDWCCNARLGRALTRFVLSRVWPTRLYGWWHRLPRSRARIAPFVERMGIDMSEAKRPADAYESFADFFAREIELSRRPLPADPHACISPVDGKILVFPSLLDEAFCIKSHVFRLADFLRDESESRRFTGGSMAVIRLGMSDYHHVHFPAAGTPGPARLLRGRRYIGGPYAVKSWMPFYRENVRMFTPLASDAYGAMLVAEIGSFAVAGIRQEFAPGAHVPSGARKSRFEIGGSTVVLLFPPGAVRFDDDLLRNSAGGLETRVLMGECIGVPALPLSPAGTEGEK